jgi:uncharacterized membrane protein YidH (DUF202 family)
MVKGLNGKTEGASSSEGSEPLSLLISEAQLILSEKRTALSVMRTGIAVFALPLSVLSILIATSNYYSPAKVLHLLIPVLLINLALIGLGIYLVVRALKRIHVLDRMIQGLKHRSKDIAQLVE